LKSNTPMPTKPSPKKSTPVKEHTAPEKEVIKVPVAMPELKSTLPVQSDDDFEMSPDELVTEKDLASKPDRYFEAVGRRKTAVARVRLFTRGEKQFLVNGKPYPEYFTLVQDQQTATASMRKMKCLDKFKVTVVVSGGGRNAQAEAVRHGTARVLVAFNGNFKKRLKKVSYLTRDPRMRERKKFGLKRARKAPQWAKR
jgi:small subunit ribosomal protein S9